MRNLKQTVVSALVLLVAANANAQSGSTTVLGTANIYRSGGNTMTNYSGGGQGTSPNQIMLNSGTSRTLTLTASGTWGCAGTDGFTVDGSTCAGSATTLNSSGSISGIQMSGRTMPLVGVFLGSSLPGSAPAGLNYNGTTLTFTQTNYSAPLLGQLFFIGDGLTGTGTGINQIFGVPDGATTLFLGVADGFAFNGNPGYYDDNVGQITARYNIAESNTVPEPSSVALLSTGLVGLVPVLPRLRR